MAEKHEHVGRMEIKPGRSIITTSIHGVGSESFGIYCIRGFAPLAQLAQISQVDEYHQKINPLGYQRFVSLKHAKEAYRFASDHAKFKKGLWPEVILNIRNEEVFSLDKGKKYPGGTTQEVKLKVNWPKLAEVLKEDSEKKLIERRVLMARVDGNHRLYYAGGDFEKKGQYKPLESFIAPFCILSGVDLMTERKIFLDINQHQKKLAGDHILREYLQLLGPDAVWGDAPHRILAQELNTDSDSPLFQKVDLGGKRKPGDPLYLAKLKDLSSGLEHLLDGSEQDFKEHGKEFSKKVVIQYYKAIQEVFSVEFLDSQNYKLQSSVGHQAFGYLGRDILDVFKHRAIPPVKEEFSKRLIAFKRESPEFWRKTNEYWAGKSGRPAAEQAAKEMWEIVSDVDGKPKLRFEKP